MEPRAYLDTHVVLWLRGDAVDRLSPRVRAVVDEATELHVSPMVVLELQLLYELHRIDRPGTATINQLRDQVGLQISDDLFGDVVDMAASLSWTRDPFDRLIVAHAQLHTAPLLTKDRTIRANYERAVW